MNTFNSKQDLLVVIPAGERLVAEKLAYWLAWCFLYGDASPRNWGEMFSPDVKKWLSSRTGRDCSGVEPEDFHHLLTKSVVEDILILDYFRQTNGFQSPTDKLGLTHDELVAEVRKLGTYPEMGPSATEFYRERFKSLSNSRSTTESTYVWVNLSDEMGCVALQAEMEAIMQKYAA